MGEEIHGIIKFFELLFAIYGFMYTEGVTDKIFVFLKLNYTKSSFLVVFLMKG